MNFKKQFYEGLLTKNPVTVQLLGMCSVLAITTSLFNGIGMGLAVTVILTCSNILISALRKVIPSQIRIAAYIVIIAGFVTIVDLVSKVYASDAGYAVQVTPGGFDNTITMMVGVDKAGSVLGISIISHTETAGLGAVAAAGTPAGEAFRNEFVGASGSVSVTKDGGEIDAITGATITSRAVCVGVNAALECVANMG